MINFPLTPTRYQWAAEFFGSLKTRDAGGLAFGMQAPGLWRIVQTGTHPACVGPQYKTKAELLADLPRYAYESWGLC